MAELNVTKKSISSLFSEMQGTKFIIPDYQRPYKWDLEKCEILWQDLTSFFEERTVSEEYYLGTVVTYGSLIFERVEEIGLKLEDEQRCKRKDRKSRRYTTAICRTEANGSPRATRQIFSSTWE